MFDRKSNNDTQVGVHKPADLPLIVPNELAVEFKVKEFAKENSSKNLPSLTASSPDSNEQNFRIRLTGRANQAMLRTQEFISLLENRHVAIMISKENTDIEKMPNEFKTKTKAELKPILDRIKEDKEECRLTEDELIKFKKSNNLDREADYPETLNKVSFFVVVMLVLESVINGSFFAAGSDGGLIGGFIMAIAFSFINLALAFVNGRIVLPYKNHILPQRKWIYGAIAVFIIILLLVLNLLIAHYREALILNPDNASVLAWDSLRNGLLSITDIESWLLAILGFAFAIITMFKGYDSDDKYPGYGKLTRKKYEKIEDLKNERSSAQKKLVEIHEEFLTKIDDKEKVMNSNYIESTKIISDIEYYRKLIEPYIKSCETGYKQIVTLYREENTSARQDGVPEYFGQPIDSSLKIDKIKITYSDNRKEMKATIENLNVSMIEIRNEMQEIKKYFITETNVASNL